MHKPKHIPVTIRQDLAFVSRFLAKVLIGAEDECWPWLGALDANGYGKIKMPGGGKLWKASRVSFTLFWGEIPSELLIMHSCDTPKCVNPWHLSPGTNAENTADMVSKGRNVAPAIRRGNVSEKAVLTESQVREIRSSRETIAAYARRFGVSRQAAHQAKHGTTWSHL